LIASSIASRSVSGSWVMKPCVPLGLVTSEEWLRLPSKEARIRLDKGGRVFGPMACVFFDVVLKREEKRNRGGKKSFTYLQRSYSPCGTWYAAHPSPIGIGYIWEFYSCLVVMRD
jgi:hypothetical protein